MSPLVSMLSGIPKSLETFYGNFLYSIVRVCLSVRWCFPVCGLVCPSVGGCVPVCEGVSQCVRVCHSV